MLHNDISVSSQEMGSPISVSISCLCTQIYTKWVLNLHTLKSEISRNGVYKFPQFVVKDLYKLCLEISTH